ncbi:MAG: hypothetical protein QRY16_10845 [Enterobacterales bacterium endosymbiont of Blomia tropicalis]|uniref:hypothetical protein n=1 Tax=Mixta mediterraneensis TaxID=2758443 RepID=UPI001873A892|nr:hypothetical protein [Mixta mediterraneensis]MBE5253646.1 hypothetical protein [Mixta mediterraneensis]MDL4914263.1 hypothetical protein [Mixta mediterraneensis]
MKTTQILLLGMLVSGSALAADDNEQNVYASQLCHIVSSEHSTSNADQYVEKMKSNVAQSQSSSAMKKPEFDEDTAHDVVSAWLQLGDDERAKLRSDEQQCEQAVMAQFQQED